MFKCLLWILSDGGDGVPFPVNSPLGYLFSGITCVAVGLAVYSVYDTPFNIFFPVFYNFNHP
jgi:hypothetical protein